MIEAVNRYVDLLCHEINNPFTIVIGQTALTQAQIERGDFERSTALERLKRVDDGSQRVVGLLRELREAFRQVSGEVTEVVEIGPLLAEARRFNLRWCRVKGGQLILEPTPEKYLTAVRPVHVRGILWRAMATALLVGPPVTVRTTLEREWLAVTIAVAGSAFDPEEWQPHLRADAVTVTLTNTSADRGLELRFPRVD